MRKERIKRRVCYFGGFLLLCTLLYSCLQDEWSVDSGGTQSKVIEGKNRELTIAVARSWYEANQTPVVATRSVVTHFELMTKLRWKQAAESRNNYFEVVEVPLFTKGGAVLLDRETQEKYNPETDRKKIRNVSRMVIIKNLKTGKITNFVMYIVGTYDYLKKAKHFGKNSYLYRDPHLTGSVCFYKPEGGLVNGWKYEDGKIVGAIHQGTMEGLKMQAAVSTRAQNCYFDMVLVTHNECEGFTYDDPEYGLGFGSECTEIDVWEPQEICTDIDEGDDDGGDDWGPSGGGNSSGGGSSGSGGDGGSSSGGSSGGYRPAPVAPKAKAIFRNSTMTEANWKVIEKMLDKIMKNCMGESLYNGLKKALNGKTLTIKFIENENSAFTMDGGIKLRTDAVSGDFLHEMLHAYQSYHENYNSMMDAKINMEIETHYAQYIYQKSLPEYNGSKWEKRDNTSLRWKAISRLTKYIDNKGNLHSNTNIPELESRILNHVIPALYKGGYSSEKYPVDYDRLGLENFKNIRELTKNC